MKKRIFFSLLSMLMTGQLLACPKDGLYIGAGAGASFDETKITARNTVTDFRVTRKPSETHAVGNVFLGYGHTFCNCFFLGIEGGTYFPRRRLTATRMGVDLTSFLFRNHISVQDYFTGDLLPGLRLCSDLLLYARGGCSVAHLRFQQDANVIAGAPQFENSTTQCGWRAGVGVHYSFFSNLSLGADYFYSSYPKITTQLTGFNVAVDAKTHANYVGVALTYHFPICCRKH